MAELFRVTGAFSFRSPICFADGFRKAIIELNLPSDHAIAMLCHRIWSSLDCAAFAFDDHSIGAVLQADRKQELTTLLERVQRETPEINFDAEDDEISAGLLLRQAIHESLCSCMISRGWTRLDGRVLCFGRLGEQTTLEAISVDVQLSASDQVVLLLSADVVTFHLTKAVESMPEPSKRRFEDGKEVLTDDYLWKLEEWARNDHECCVLPSLRGGHIVAFTKTLEGHEKVDMDHRREIWLSQNGLRVPSPGYYIKVSFDMNAGDSAWFPACLVITKAALVPVLPSYRCSQLLQVVEHWKSDMGEWNYFRTGKIKLKEVSCPSEKRLWISSAACSEEITSDGLDITSFCGLKLDALQKFLRARQHVEHEPKTDTPSHPKPASTAMFSKPPLVRVPKFKRVHAGGSSEKSRVQAKSTLTEAPASLMPETRPAIEAASNPETRPVAADRNEQTRTSEVRPAKRAKESADPVETQVVKKHAEGKLKELNVAELKGFLRLRKCKVGGKKEELIQRICELLS